PEELLTLVGERLGVLVRPHACALYAPLGEELVPVFGHRIDSEQSPPALPADARSIAALRTRSAPLDLARWKPSPLGLPTSDERAALEAIRAAVLLPVRRGAELAAVVCLGAKRSGDVYTDTD